MAGSCPEIRKITSPIAAMKTRKPNLEELKSQLTARRRFHEAGNRRNDTVTQRQKRERIGEWAAWTGAIVLMPTTVVLLVQFDKLALAPLSQPLLLVSCYLGLCSTMHLIFMFLRPKPCYGRWIIVHAGIFSRYGKSPHRFTPFSSLRNLHVEQPQSPFAVIAFDTDHEPLRIAKHAGPHLLPFLNLLIDHLRRNGRAETDLTPLFQFQRILQGRLASRCCLQCEEWLVLACSLATPFCVLPFSPYISTFPYPAIWWVVAFCIVVVVVIFFALHSRLERWRERKIDKILQSLSLDGPGA